MPTISRNELVGHLKQRAGRVPVNREDIKRKINAIPDSMPTVRLDALLGEMTMRVLIEAVYEEFKERITASSAGTVAFID